MLNTIEHGPIHELRLARPPANALNPELIRTLDEAITGAPDRGAGALVLSGSEGLFTAGLDVPELLTLDRDGIHRMWVDFFKLLHDIAASPIPIASAITGHSPAGGAVLAIHTDHRIMADGNFTIGLNEVQVGLPLPDVIFRTLRYVVGPRQAERLSVFGALVPPAEALEVGLVDEVVPVSDVVPRAIAWCERILKLPPAARVQTRALAREELVRGFDGLDEASLQPWVDIWFSDETQRTLGALVARLRG